MMINTHTEFLFGLMLTIGSPQNNYLLTVFSRAGRHIVLSLIESQAYSIYGRAFHLPNGTVGTDG